MSIKKLDPRPTITTPWDQYKLWFWRSQTDGCWKNGPFQSKLVVETIFGDLHIAYFKGSVELFADLALPYVQFGQWAVAFIGHNARSCKDCQHYRETYSPGNYDEPPDYWVDCDKNWPLSPLDYECEMEFEEGDQGVLDASRCPAYQFFDWDAHHNREAELDALAYDQWLESERQREAYEKSPQGQAELFASIEQDYKARGWLNESGELTDAFYSKAQFDYEVSRGLNQ
jgi:hypothetical protein